VPPHRGRRRALPRLRRGAVLSAPGPETGPPLRAREAVAIGLAAATLLGVQLGAGSLRDWDEAIYAQVAREIAEGGGWLTLRLDGEPWFMKPPLGMWASALGFRAFGVGELAPRLLPAVSGVLLVLGTLAFGARAFGAGAGRLAALVLLGTPSFVEQARLGMLDVPLALAGCTALWAWWRAEREPRWLVAAGAALGAGVMLKGAAGLLPALAAALHAALTGRLGVLRTRWLWAGALAFAAVALPWHLHQLAVHGAEFRDAYLGYHVLQRAGTALEGHESSPLFYLDVLARDAFPWGLAGLVALPWCAWRAGRRRDPALLLVVIWALVALAVPTLMRTRIEWYVLPAWPALALAIAVALGAWLPRRRRAVFAAAALVLVANAATSRRLLDPDYSPGARGLAPAIQAALPPDAALCAYRVSPPALRFYAERRTVHVRGLEDPRWARLRTRPVLCATREEFLPELAPFGARELARAADRVLLEVGSPPAPGDSPGPGPGARR
jgi:4-amino-4-deoxy-L-arabinose transferase-like glycosyltransferase